MRVSALAALSVGAIFSTMQYCPAPFAAGLGALAGMSAGTIAAADGAVSAMAGGAIAGGMGHIPRGIRGKKRANLPPGVSQESFDQCQDQLNGAQVKLSGQPPDSVRVDGVPPACMNLATVITGKPTQEGGAVPVPMGSDSLQYHGLSQDELKQLGEALKAKGIIQ